MRRRPKEGEEAGQWPPEHLRHFNAADWPGLIAPADWPHHLPIESRPPSSDCAACAFYDALEQWRLQWREENPEGALDPIACCPAYPDCGKADAGKPDDVFHWDLI